MRREVLLKADVMAVLGVSDPRTLDGYIRAGRFPKPFRFVTPRRPLWRVRDVEDWLGCPLSQASTGPTPAPKEQGTTPSSWCSNAQAIG